MAIENFANHSNKTKVQLYVRQDLKGVFVESRFLLNIMEVFVGWEIFDKVS